MRARRVLLLSASLLVGASFAAVACTNSDPIYIYVEAGSTDVRNDRRIIIDEDSGEGDTACTPQAGADQVPFTPSGGYQNKCDEQTIDTLVQSCFVKGATDAQCKAATDALNDDCFNCVLAGPTQAPTSVLVYFGGDYPPTFNYGVCASSVAGETDPKSCSYAVGKFELCTQAACAAPCDGKSTDAYDACQNEAAGTVCNELRLVVAAANCQAEITGTKFGFCGEKIDAAFLKKAVSVSCGARPADSGAADGSTSDASSDAGDAGEADADAGDADAMP